MAPTAQYEVIKKTCAPTLHRQSAQERPTQDDADFDTPKIDVRATHKRLMLNLGIEKKEEN